MSRGNTKTQTHKQYEQGKHENTNNIRGNTNASTHKQYEEDNVWLKVERCLVQVGKMFGSGWKNSLLEANFPNLCNIELDQWERGYI